MNILFFGTPDFSVPTLRALIRMPGVSVKAVFTQPDRPSGRGGHLTQSPIKQVANEHSIPVIQPQSLRKEFASIRPNLDALGTIDLGIVIAYGQILPQEVLDYPRHGCVNIHASLLPRWRGAAPIQRSIEAGDAETGVCLMKMEKGLDTGAVYSESRIPILVTDTGGSLHDRLAHLGAELLARDLEAIASGALKAIPQANDGVTYAHKLSSEEALIKWDRPAEEIVRSIRAFAPWPGSFTMWRGKRLKILLAKRGLSTPSPSTPPGTILYGYGDRFEIACGESSSLLVTEVQIEGKKRMSASEFLRGSSLPPGEILGS